jgi:hypothetical protein
MQPNNSATYACLVNIYQESEHLYHSIPRMFIDQASSGKNAFYIRGDQMQGANRVFLLAITDCEEMEGGFALKVGLSCVKDESNGLVVLAQNNRDKNANWFGVRSPSFIISQKDVDLGKFAQSAYDILPSYAEHVKNMKTQYGNTSWSYDVKDGMLYLSPLRPTSVFQFLMEVRQNPTSGEKVLGISPERFALSGAYSPSGRELGGWGVLGSMASSIAYPMDEIVVELDDVPQVQMPQVQMPQVQMPQPQPKSQIILPVSKQQQFTLPIPSNGQSLGM